MNETRVGFEPNPNCRLRDRDHRKTSGPRCRQINIEIKAIFYKILQIRK